MDSNEQFVRKHWISSYEPIVQSWQGIHLCLSGEHYFTGKAQLSSRSARNEMWQAAREFTEKRLEEIRQVEEEIEWLKCLFVPMRDIAPAMRCRKRVEAALAALKQGMKGER